MSADLARRFGIAYASAFRSYLISPDEGALRGAYELGREAVNQGLSVLDLALAHHDALTGTFGDLGDLRELRPLTEAAGEFFVESLSAFEMVQRGYREARAAAVVERHHAELLRQLSHFLADASLALDTTGSREEMLRLVEEQARELVGARACVVTAALEGGPEPPEPDGPSSGRLTAALTALDGRRLGVIEVSDKQDGEFTEVDRAVLVHLAQMASAALERAALYRRSGVER